MESMHKSLTLGSLFDGIGGWQLMAARCRAEWHQAHLEQRD